MKSKLTELPPCRMLAMASLEMVFTAGGSSSLAEGTSASCCLADTGRRGGMGKVELDLLLCIGCGGRVSCLAFDFSADGDGVMLEGFAGRLGFRAAAAFGESVAACRLVFLVAGEDVLLLEARTAAGFLSPEVFLLLAADDAWSTDSDRTYKLEVDLDLVMVAAEDPLFPWFLAYKKGPGLLPLAPPDLDSKIFLVSLTVSGAGSSFSARPKRTLVDLRLYEGLPARESWAGEIFLCPAPLEPPEEDPFRDFSTMTMSSLARLLTAASTGSG